MCTCLREQKLFDVCECVRVCVRVVHVGSEGLVASYFGYLLVYGALSDDLRAAVCVYVFTCIYLIVILFSKCAFYVYIFSVVCFSEVC